MCWFEGGLVRINNIEKRKTVEENFSGAPSATIQEC